MASPDVFEVYGHVKSFFFSGNNQEEKGRVCLCVRGTESLKSAGDFL